LPRRKNELDVSAIITDPFIAHGIMKSKWENVKKIIKKKPKN